MKYQLKYNDHNNSTLRTTSPEQKKQDSMRLSIYLLSGITVTLMILFLIFLETGLYITSIVVSGVSSVTVIANGVVALTEHFSAKPETPYSYETISETVPHKTYNYNNHHKSNKFIYMVKQRNQHV